MTLLAAHLELCLQLRVFLFAILNTTQLKHYLLRCSGRIQINLKKQLHLCKIISVGQSVRKGSKHIGENRGRQKKAIQIQQTRVEGFGVLYEMDTFEKDY